MSDRTKSPADSPDNRIAAKHVEKMFRIHDRMPIPVKLGSKPGRGVCDCKETAERSGWNMLALTCLHELVFPLSRAARDDEDEKWLDLTQLGCKQDGQIGRWTTWTIEVHRMISKATEAFCQLVDRMPIGYLEGVCVDEIRKALTTATSGSAGLLEWLMTWSDVRPVPWDAPASAPDHRTKVQIAFDEILKNEDAIRSFSQLMDEFGRVAPPVMMRAMITMWQEADDPRRIDAMLTTLELPFGIRNPD